MVFAGLLNGGIGQDSGTAKVEGLADGPAGGQGGVEPRRERPRGHVEDRGIRVDGYDMLEAGLEQPFDHGCGATGAQERHPGGRPLVRGEHGAQLQGIDSQRRPRAPE